MQTLKKKRAKNRPVDDFHSMVRSYIATALWASTDTLPENLQTEDTHNHIGEDIELDQYVATFNATISIGVLKQAIKDCRAFITLVHDELMPDNAERVTQQTATDLDYLWPHDFFLTRNHHGAGFWDGDWQELGACLTDLSHRFPPVDLYIGDDGRIYQ